MKEKVKQLNIENTQTQLIIKKGENIYNSLRNSDIVLYLDEFKGKLGLQDKKCLSLYLSIIQSDNFFNKLLKKLNYEKFTNFSNKDTNNYHFEDEFNEFVNTFDIDNYLEVMILYLLDYPIIKQLNLKEGYSIWKMKLAVYDYLSTQIKETIDKGKNKQKVLTK